MLEWSNLALFFAASWILIITPGPDMVYVITRGVSQGRRAGMVSAAGVTLGILVHTLFAACGLAIILRTSAMAFLVVKLAGAAYLIYLGVRAFIEKTEFSLAADNSQEGMRKVFVQGVLCNVLNPKVALFFLAFLPQFVTPGPVSASIQMMCFGFIFAVFGVIFLVLLGYFSGGFGAWLDHRQRYLDKIRWFTGSVLIALGLRLAFLDRR